MSGEIKLRASEAIESANDVRKSKGEAFDILDGLRGRMNNLSDSFTGKAHDAFMAKLDEWKQSSDKLLEALNGLGDFLQKAAETIEQVDQDLAAQLGG